MNSNNNASENTKRYSSIIFFVLLSLQNLFDPFSQIHFIFLFYFLTSTMVPLFVRLSYIELVLIYFLVDNKEGRSLSTLNH